MRKKRIRSPNHYYSDRVIVENCINAFVDAGNNIQGIWDYLTPLIDKREITQPYAKRKCAEALNVIYGALRFYKEKGLY